MKRDKEVELMKKERSKGKTITQSAAAGNMCEKTARKYLAANKLPSDMRLKHRDYRTRVDVFETVWPHITELLESNPGLQAKTIFKHLQRKHPDEFQDGQIRSLQRKIKRWRATAGPNREIMFEQIHKPGILCQSDFTCMNQLGIRIAGSPFKHLFYHFVLTYSNWETGSICYSESFESLSDGLQNALWTLGGVPLEHRTDRLTAAVNNHCNRKEFNKSYLELSQHYKLSPCKTQPYSPNENGDVEQSHYRFKTAVDQALMLRGSRDFESLETYTDFLDQIQDELNAGRRQRFEEEIKILQKLPPGRLNSCKVYQVKVNRSSVIKAGHNRYSVPSRLIGETIRVHQYANYLEVWYAGSKVQQMPRLRGENKHSVDYRHVIQSLVRKPGAFENYRYRDFMFPSSNFRITYDILKKTDQNGYVKKYLKVLHLATMEGEQVVEHILCDFINTGCIISVELIKQKIDEQSFVKPLVDVFVEEPDLVEYDVLLQEVLA